MRLTLHLFTADEIELSRVELMRGGASPIVCVRGKSQDHDADGCFQWTSAVKAFTQLAVGTRLAVARGEKGFHLSGEQGSPAASLDYAISKPTQWVVDLFGREQGGRPFASRAFQRHNSERKLPGPVSVQLAPSFAETGAIRIYLDGDEISDASSLEALSNGLGGRSNERAAQKGRPAEWYRDAWFEAAMNEEILRALSDVTLMEPMALERTRGRLSRFDWAASSESIDTALRQVEESVSGAGSRYRDVSGDQLRALSGTAIQISIVPFALGALALFQYMKAELGIALELDYRFSGAVEIARESEREIGPSARVLSWGAVSRLPGPWHESQSALALLPRTGFSIVAPSGGTVSDAQVVYAADDPRGYPRQILEECSIFRRKPELRSASLAEIPSRLSGREGAAILAFPLSVIDGRLFGGEVCPAEGAGGRIADNVLIASSIEEEARRALLAALRTAWFRLLEKDALRKSTVRLLLEEMAYVEFLERLGGLHAMR